MKQQLLCYIGSEIRTMFSKISKTSNLGLNARLQKERRKARWWICHFGLDIKEVEETIEDDM